MLQLIVERLKSVSMLDRIVVATSVQERDDVIADLVEGLPETGMYRGPENDVLARFYGASAATGAEFVLRVTADNPLVDPPTADRLLKMVVDRGCDYAANNLEPTFPVGLDLEAFTYQVLAHAHRKASHPEHREHVTPYIREHPEQFKQCGLTLDQDLSHLRFTVDTQEDFDRIRVIFEEHGPHVRFLDVGGG